MIPAAPASIAGLVTMDVGDFTIWIQFLISPGLPTIAWLTPGVLVGVNPKALTFRADSSVSFPQRPGLPATPNPAGETEVPAIKTPPGGGAAAFEDSPPDPKKRPTAVGSPTTASPSPSLMSST